MAEYIGAATSDPWTPSSLPYLIAIFIASGVAASYYTAVELEKKCYIQKTDREQTDRKRNQL